MARMKAKTEADDEAAFGFAMSMELARRIQSAGAMRGAITRTEFGNPLDDKLPKLRVVNPREKANGTKRPITIIPFDEIRLNPNDRPYVVKGLIPREGITVVWGPPKSGKSFKVFDLCMHVALGWEYRGRRVQQGAVVYCSFEGQAGL